jgi:hypothetical protein
MRGARIFVVAIIAVIGLSAFGFYYACHIKVEPEWKTSDRLPVNAVLIGWDGAQRNHLKEMIAQGEVPNLMALAAEGRLVDIDVTTGATDTKAGWAQILTGYAPEKTGVYSNNRYQPIPVGYTVFERLENFFGPENIVTAAIVGKKGNVDADGPRKIPFEQWALIQRRLGYQVPRPRVGANVREGGKIVEENGTIWVAFTGKPYFYTKDHMDMFVNGLEKNERVGMFALTSLEKCKDRRFFFFIHFAEPDHAGHKYGENSQEYTDAIKLDDEWTGKIVAKLKEMRVYERTLVYVTADHGFDEGKTTHSYAPYVFLATNDPRVMRSGDRMDIAPTILKRFGLDLARIEPELDGTPLDEPIPGRIHTWLSHRIHSPATETLSVRDLLTDGVQDLDTELFSQTFINSGFDAEENRLLVPARLAETLEMLTADASIQDLTMKGRKCSDMTMGALT